MILLAIASLLLCRVAGTPIVGGELATIHKHPWLASVQLNGELVCAGSVVSKIVILTTAGCITENPIDSLSVRVGSSELGRGGSEHRIVEGKIHERYTSIDGKSMNSVALIKVHPPIDTCGDGAKPIQLPGRDKAIVPMDTAVVVAGWGKMPGNGSAYTLRSTQLRVIHNIDCADRYKYYVFPQFVNWDELICTGTDGTGVCHGDAGSPLVTPDGVQVGLTSWSFSCGESEYPGVYANVASYRDWIDKNLKILDPPRPPPVVPDTTNFFWRWFRRAFWTWSISGSLIS